MKVPVLPYFILSDDLTPILRRVGLPLMAALCLGSASHSCLAQITPGTRPLSNSLAADETGKSACTLLDSPGKSASQSGSALSATRPTPDRKAEALLEKLATRTKALKSLSATITVTSTGTENGKARTPGHSKGVLRLQRPNFAYCSVSGDPPDLTACDGKMLTIFLTADIGPANTDEQERRKCFRQFQSLRQLLLYTGAGLVEHDSRRCGTGNALPSRPENRRCAGAGGGIAFGGRICAYTDALYRPERTTLPMGYGSDLPKGRQKPVCRHLLRCADRSADAARQFCLHASERGQNPAGRRWGSRTAGCGRKRPGLHAADAR